MRWSNVIKILIFILFSKYFLDAQIQLCSDDYPNSSLIMDGEYNIMNNVWGADTKQCIEFYEDSTYFRVFYSEHNNTGGSPAAYPSIFKGCHWGWCTTKNNPLPIQIKRIKKAPLSWIVDTDGVSGTWNAAFDGWFDDNKSCSGGNCNYKAEIMIWIDFGGGAGPGGSRIATANIADHKWDLYYASAENWAGWNYIAYKIQDPIDTLQIDLFDFIRDATSRGYMYSDWYFVASEVGFEIWSGGQGLTTKKFSFDAEKTDSIMNYAPTAFKLSYPFNGMVLPSMNINFSWTKAIDPDRDEVKYILNIVGSNLDTMITDIDTTRYLFNASGVLDLNTSYSWRVLATDGKDTTYTKFMTFKTPKTSSLEQRNEVHREFKLNQNYPNPFNKGTQIKFIIPYKANVLLEIFDLTGRKIKTLLSGEVNQGIYVVTWNGIDNAGRPVNSGVYLYVLKSRDLNVVRKMLYIK